MKILRVSIFADSPRRKNLRKFFSIHNTQYCKRTPFSLVSFVHCFKSLFIRYNYVRKRANQWQTPYFKVIQPSQSFLAIDNSDCFFPTKIFVDGVYLSARLFDFYPAKMYETWKDQVNAARLLLGLLAERMVQLCVSTSEYALWKRLNSWQHFFTPPKLIYTQIDASSNTRFKFVAKLSINRFCSWHASLLNHSFLVASSWGQKHQEVDVYMGLW